MTRARGANNTGDRAVLMLALAGAIAYVIVILAQSAIGRDGGVTTPGAGAPASVPSELLVYLLGTAVVFVIYAALVFRCLRLPVGRKGRAILFGVPVALQVLMLPAMPAFSVDVFSYIAHGATGLLQAGGDAYSTAPRDVLFLPVGQALRGLGWNPAPGTSPYGPLWTLIEAAIARLPVDVATDVAVFKAIETGAVLGSAAIIWYLLGRVNPSGQLAGTVAFLWNPVILVELSGEGHNDGLMVMFVLLGLYATVRSVPARAMITSTLGVVVKYLPALFVPAQLVYLWRTTPDRARLVRGVTLGLVASIGLATALFAPFWGPNMLSGLTRSSGGGPWPIWPTISGVMYSWIGAILPTVDASALKTILLGGMFGSYLLFESLRVKSEADLVRAAANIALVYMLVVSAVYWPWYAVLPIALLSLVPLQRSFLLLLVLSVGSRLVAPLAAGMRPEVGLPADAWANATILTILVVLGTFLAVEATAFGVHRLDGRRPRA
jgi:alpha-1,6-mannosyltransferase